MKVNLFNSGAPVANFYALAANVGTFGGFANGDDIIGRYYNAGVRLESETSTAA